MKLYFVVLTFSSALIFSASCFAVKQYSDERSYFETEETADSFQPLPAPSEYKDVRYLSHHDHASAIDKKS